MLSAAVCSSCQQASLLASRIEADSDYFGIVLASMVVMAVGLGLTTGPATESIMGALPEAKAGWAPRSTTPPGNSAERSGGPCRFGVRECVCAQAPRGRGSARSSRNVYRMPLRSRWAGARGRATATQGVADEFIHMAQRAFMDGFTRGSLVAAAATLIGGIAVFLFLPARHAE